MLEIFKRSKKNYSSARKAWKDIAKETGLKPNQVKSSHTKDSWIWKKK